MTERVDRWIHKSSMMLCKTCMCFMEKGKSSQNGTVVGRCRRHSPTMGGWPVVFEDDWCYDHKLDESKI